MRVRPPTGIESARPGREHATRSRPRSRRTSSADRVRARGARARPSEAMSVQDRPRTLSRRSGTRTSSSPETAETPGGPLRRPAPRPRGDLAAGVRGAARARPAGAPARAHRRDDGPLDADATRAERSACAGRRAPPARRSARSRRTAATSACTLYALGNERQGIVHVIGPELGLTQPGHDHRLRRQPHQHARRVRRARLRHRHERGRRTCSRRSACCSAGRRRSRSSSTGRLRPGVTAKDLILGADRAASASAAPPATSSSTAAPRSARCRWTSA